MIYTKYVVKLQKHIVIDARIRRSSTGRPVDRLLEYLPELDAPYRFTVIVAKGDDWQPKNKKPASRQARFSVVKSRFPIFSFNPLQQVLYALQLYRLKPDLVYFTMTSQQPLFYFGPQITFTHDLSMLKYVRPGRLPKWLHRVRMWGYRLLLWQSHRKARQIIVPSEYVRLSVQKYHLFTARKVTVCYEATEPAIANEAIQPEGVEKPFILHVGNPFPHKNLRRLVKAFEKIHKSQPGLSLVLAGKKEYYFKNLERWSSKRVSYASTHFTGRVSDAELKWLYAHAEAYVLPSLSEGFGLPGLEAMANGCPLISSDATCLPEIYGDAARYFDPHDEDSIARAIQKVLNHDEIRADLVKKGHAQVKKYSWQRFTEENLAVIDSTIN